MNENFSISSTQADPNPVINDLVTCLNQLLDGKSESEVRQFIKTIGKTHSNTGKFTRQQGGIQKSPSDCLSNREKEVLRLLAQGGTRRTIGISLQISANTVAKHITNTYRKLRISTVAEATQIAINDKLI